MVENRFRNSFVKIKVVGVNTSSEEKISGGLSVLNFMLEKNFSGINYFAVDRQDVKNLDACNAKYKFRLLDMSDERNLVRALRGADLLFVVADKVWENIKAVALTAHCAKKTSAPVIFIAGGDFEDAEDEIIFDALIKLPSKNFEFDACTVIKNFIDVVTLSGQPKTNLEDIADMVKNSAAIVSYGNHNGRNAIVKAAKAALQQAEGNADNFDNADKILFNVIAAKGNFSLEEAQKIYRIFKRHAPKAEISLGFSIDDWLVDKVKVLMMTSIKTD